MDRYKVFSHYKEKGIQITDRKYFENLAMIFQSLLKKRTGFEREKTFDFFNSELINALIEPLDYEVCVQNKKELLMRLIYVYFSKNDHLNALNIFLYMIHYYNVCSSFIWRTGFQILLKLGDELTMHNFFNAMLDNNVWDPSNMIYEYFLYLLEKKDYNKIREIYLNKYREICKHKRVMREPEMENLHHYIKLTVAVSFYCSWKHSLISGREDDDFLFQAELEFKEIIPAIKKNLIVDGYLLNYLEILEYQQKFEVAFDVLKLYYETSLNNIHAKEYLLDFMIRNKQYCSSITKENISEVRAHLVSKQVGIRPEDSSQFVLQAFKKHIEDLSEEGNHEEIVKLLIKHLGDSRWAACEWPWRFMLDGVRHLGVDSCFVRNTWSFVEDLWTDLFFSCPQNSYISQLSQLFQSSSVPKEIN